MNKLIIFGYGHLAKYLSEFLGSYKVTATRTSAHNNYNNIEILKYILGEDISSSMDKSPSAVIWMIPPRENYLKTLKKAEQFFNKEVPWIFISSTSVYKQGCVDEQSPLDGESSNAKKLIKIEQYLSKVNRDVAILRPGGLVDEHRHPSKFLSKKSVVDGGADPVNLVHTRDVAKFIYYLLENREYLNTYNLVSDTHLTKQEYYQPFINKYFNTNVEFKNTHKKSKLVENTKSKSTGFKYDFLDVTASNLRLFVS